MCAGVPISLKYLMIKLPGNSIKATNAKIVDKIDFMRIEMEGSIQLECITVLAWTWQYPTCLKIQNLLGPGTMVIKYPQLVLIENPSNILIIKCTLIL